MFVFIQSVIGLNLKFPLCWLTLSVPQASNFSSDTLFLRCRLFCQRIFLGVYSPERICHLYFFHPYSTIIFSMFVTVLQGKSEGWRLFSDVSIQPQFQTGTRSLALRSVALTSAPVIPLAVALVLACDLAVLPRVEHIKNPFPSHSCNKFLSVTYSVKFCCSSLCKLKLLFHRGDGKNGSRWSFSSGCFPQFSGFSPAFPVSVWGHLWSKTCKKL